MNRVIQTKIVHDQTIQTKKIGRDSNFCELLRISAKYSERTRSFLDKGVHEQRHKHTVPLKVSIRYGIETLRGSV